MSSNAFSPLLKSSSVSMHIERFKSLIYDISQDISETLNHLTIILEAFDGSGFTSLSDYCLAHSDCDEIARLGFEQYSVLQLIMETRLSEADKAILIKPLLGYKKEILDLNYYGNTALHEAINRGHHEILRTLVQSVEPECINICNHNGETPLHKAVLANQMDDVLFLLERGAQPDLQNSNSETPLFFAARIKSIEAMKALLQYEVSVNTIHQSSNSILQFALKENAFAVSELLLKHGANVHYVNSQGWSPLHFACRYGDEQSIRLLLSHGADVQLAANSSGWSALHFACASSQTQNAHLILAEGGLVNALSHLKSSPLHIATKHHRTETVKLLIAHGADPFLVSEHGQTALMIAEDQRNDSMSEFLKEVQYTLQESKDIHASLPPLPSPNPAEQNSVKMPTTLHSQKRL